jgi:hypothetical protein
VRRQTTSNTYRNPLFVTLVELLGNASVVGSSKVAVPVEVRRIVPYAFITNIPQDFNVQDIVISPPLPDYSITLGY